MDIAWGLQLSSSWRAVSDKLFNVAGAPRGNACAQFERLRKLAVTDPAPDGGGTDRQDAGFGWDARNICDADDTCVHLMPLVVPRCCGMR